jgi:tetratricopeptide (TPR) repeat protein
MSRHTTILAFVGALAVCLRCLYVWQIGHAPFVDLRIGDAAGYHVWAQGIAAGDWLGHGAFYQAPLYPYFLAASYKVFGDGVTTVRLIQAVIGAGSCVLLAAAGMRLFGERGALAGLLLAIYPSAIFLDGLLEKSVLVTLFTATLLFLLSKPIRPAAALMTGVVLGLLALTRENALLLAMPITLWMAKRDRESFSDAPPKKTPDLFLPGVFLLGCAVILVPVGLRNYAMGGEFALTTSQFGPNFYIGNHAGANGAYEALVRGHGSVADEQADATELAQKASGRTLTPGEVSAFWTKQSLAYIRSQPSAWFKQLARKFALTFNAAELADTESQDLYLEWSRVLWLLRPFNFGVLLGLAAFGFVLTWPLRRKLWFLYALAVTYAFSVVMFYVFARYRFPLAPILMVLAAGGLAELGRKRPPALLAAAGAAALAVAFAHLPLGASDDARVTHELDIANALSKDPARRDLAMTFYQRALRDAPQLPPVQSNLAMFLAQTGHSDEAIPHYRAALAVWPDDAETRFNLGLALAGTGHADEAFRELTEAVRILPENVEMRLTFAQVLMAHGRPEPAADQYQRAFDLNSKNPAALVGWGIALTQLGRPQEAIEKYRLAITLDPQSSAAYSNLGWTLASQGLVAEAIPYFERALALSPGDETIRNNLERARQIR